MSDSTNTQPIYKYVNGHWVHCCAYKYISGKWMQISDNNIVNPDEFGLFDADGLLLLNWDTFWINYKPHIFTNDGNSNLMVYILHPADNTTNEITNTSILVMNTMDGFTNINAEAFCNCSKLSRVELPSNIEYIGTGAFAGCVSLKYIPLPNSLKTIDEGAFADCISLDEVSLPENLSTIGGEAFSGCTSLTNIYIMQKDATKEPITLSNDSVFYNISENAQFIFENDEVKQLYASNTNWSAYADRFVIKSTN